jgi:hypothetical protein
VQLWGPPSLLSNWYQGSFLRDTAWLGRDTDHSPSSSAEVKNERVGAIYGLSPLAPAWRVTGQLYFTVLFLLLSYVHTALWYLVLALNPPSRPKPHYMWLTAVTRLRRLIACVSPRNLGLTPGSQSMWELRWTEALGQVFLTMSSSVLTCHCTVVVHTHT